MTVEVQFAISQEEVPGEQEVARWAGAVVARMGDEQEALDVCVRVVGEAESRELNLDFRQQDKATNVLSFPADIELPDSDARILGDIVICAPVVRLEAEKQNKVLADHYAHMVVHGMLHLYGFDHVDPAEAETMEGIEREVLGRLGVADPYGLE